MSRTREDATICTECGEKLTAGTEICPKCGITSQEDWEKERDRLKTLWVVVAVFFWISMSIQGVLFALKGTLNLILLSVIGGMMVLGVVLKFRHQRHMRAKPPSRQVS